MTERTLQHGAWVIIIWAMAMGLFAIANSEDIMGVAIGAIVVLMFGSACINQIYDKYDPCIEEK